MKVALYKGTSWVSLAIRWITRSPYSHAAFQFDCAAIAGGRLYLPGTVIEAWEGGVKCSPSLSTLHTAGTAVDLFRFSPRLTAGEEQQLAERAVDTIGRPYDYLDVLRFLSRRRGTPGQRLFCSELVTMCCEQIGRPLFRQTEAWRVPPDWLSRTIALEFERSEVTV